MPKETKPNKCKHCHEDNQELSEIIYEGKKEMWCGACVEGRDLETKSET